MKREAARGRAALQTRLERRILHGGEEPIFRFLPERVLANLRHSRSETALLWNLIYPLALAGLSLGEWTHLRPLWGSAPQPAAGEVLTPYFWGYGLDGALLPGLDAAVTAVDGAWPQTEIDLFLVADRSLVLVEAKHLGSPGRCSRFASERCPEVHAVGGEPCRYWTAGDALFSDCLDFGPRPAPEGPAPPCNVHYQLGRILLVGRRLAAQLDKSLHLWLILPRERWRGLEPEWLDFAERVRGHDLWRRLRVMAWEDIAALGRRRR